jgi:hypothetical protein
MPRFLYSADAPLDPAPVLFLHFYLADLKCFPCPNPEFADLFGHQRRHVHDPLIVERVHDLFAIASFDTFSIVPAEGNLDWGICVES